MSLLSSAIRAARGAYEAVVRTASAAVSYVKRPVVSQVAPGVSVEFKAKDLDKVIGVSAGLVRVVGGSDVRSIQHVIAASMAEDMLNEIQRSLLPIRRTGELERSFHIRQAKGSIEIYSTSKYARTILGTADNWGRPSYGSLIGWMGDVGAFEIEDGRSDRQVAGAIFSSWDRDATEASSRSALYRLPPVGEKAFDYVGEAQSVVEPKFKDSGIRVIREVFREL